MSHCFKSLTYLLFSQHHQIINSNEDEDEKLVTCKDEIENFETSDIK